MSLRMCRGRVQAGAFADFEMRDGFSRTPVIDQLEHTPSTCTLGLGWTSVSFLTVTENALVTVAFYEERANPWLKGPGCAVPGLVSVGFTYFMSRADPGQIDLGKLPLHRSTAWRMPDGRHQQVCHHHRHQPRDEAGHDCRPHSANRSHQ